MIRSLILLILILASSSNGESREDPSYGVKFGILRSNLNTSYSDDNFVSYDKKSSRLGPVFGVYYRRTLAKLPMNAALSYRQEGGLDKIYYTSPLFPEGTGEYSISDTNYSLIDLSVTMRPGMRVGNVGCYLVVGGCTSYVLGVNGIFAEADSYNRFVFAHVFGIELRPFGNLEWLPSMEITSRDEFTNIYERDTGHSKVKHKIKSLSLQIGFDLH
jgi:hypothetical protein